MQDIVRPARALGSKSTTFSTFAIGSDRMAELLFRARVPTRSDQQLQLIDIACSPYSLIHTHTHTHSLSPSPSSFITHSFTLTSQWTPPIASQVPRNPLVPRPRILAPRVFCIHRRSMPITPPCLEAVKSLRARRSPRRPRSLSPKDSQFVPYAPVSYSYLDHLAFPSRSLDLPLP